jgi:hypothetical protein
MSFEIAHESRCLHLVLLRKSQGCLTWKPGRSEEMMGWFSDLTSKNMGVT